ncbi:leucine-rich repeat domain-containing protein [Flavobacterium tructae]|uniref:Two component regulator three Y domain protein n=1 Tax=Flavobacterium tructae TaxID=1114873 RepID=A0A1S1J0L9_9FLAO|nr:Two component regulator three Y domain protein [Flavobacterium tructae]OHT43350.1 Two component regulator three Y domain protein [Flavobacterium tructae]OXB19770.1 Two component regulator three Y domain protein [Flavobacterium tructae]
MKSLVLFFLAFIFSPAIFADTVSDKEKEALIKLYEATNGSEWKVKWDLSLSVATWYGVKVENGKVVGLHLANNNLQGNLPVELLTLVNLITIDLHDNKIQGQLPLEIGKLSQLETLALFNNEIQGQLPGSIYTIKTLKVLLLNQNKLSGSLSKEVSNFGVLENLSLFDNKFEGEIPNELEKLGHLSELNLSYNKFKGGVSKNLILLDALNMTMFDEEGNPFLLEIAARKETTMVTRN